MIRDIEVWKPIPEYEGIYEISNLGNIKSVGRYVIYPQGFKRWYSPKNLSPFISIWGYKLVELSKDGNKKKYSVHRLVAISFIENNENLPCVNHKDGNRLNNRADNLEWCTYEYNNTYNNRHLNAGLKISITKGTPIIQLSVNGEFVKYWNSSKQIEKELGYNHTSILNVCRGLQPSFKNYKWKFNNYV